MDFLSLHRKRLDIRQIYNHTVDKSDRNCTSHV